MPIKNQSAVISFLLCQNILKDSFNLSFSPCLPTAQQLPNITKMWTNYAKYAIINIFGSLYWTLWLVSNAPSVEDPNTWAGYLRSLAFGFSAWGWILLCCSYLAKSSYTLGCSLMLQDCFCLWYFVALFLEFYYIVPEVDLYLNVISQTLGLIWYMAFIWMAVSFVDENAAKKLKNDTQLEQIKSEKKDTSPHSDTVKL